MTTEIQDDYGTVRGSYQLILHCGRCGPHGNGSAASPVAFFGADRNDALRSAAANGWFLVPVRCPVHKRERPSDGSVVASTACLNGDHGYCAQDTGGCSCPCHDSDGSETERQITCPVCGRAYSERGWPKSACAIGYCPALWENDGSEKGSEASGSPSLTERVREISFKLAEVKSVASCRRIADDLHDGLAPLIAEMERNTLLLTRYRLALEGLTPGGSEYIGEPERCADTVRMIRSTAHQLNIRFKAERDVAENAIKQLELQVEELVRERDRLKDVLRHYEQTINEAHKLFSTDAAWQEGAWKNQVAAKLQQQLTAVTEERDRLKEMLRLSEQGRQENLRVAEELEEMRVTAEAHSLAATQSWAEVSNKNGELHQRILELQTRIAELEHR